MKLDWQRPTPILPKKTSYGQENKRPKTIKKLRKRIDRFSRLPTAFRVFPPSSSLFIRKLSFVVFRLYSFSLRRSLVSPDTLLSHRLLLWGQYISINNNPPFLPF